MFQVKQQQQQQKKFFGFFFIQNGKTKRKVLIALFLDRSETERLGLVSTLLFPCIATNYGGGEFKKLFFACKTNQP